MVLRVLYHCVYVHACVWAVFRGLLISYSTPDKCWISKVILGKGMKEFMFLEHLASSCVVENM